MASKKAQFDEYAETSGARIALARAVVALSKASLKDGNEASCCMMFDSSLVFIATVSMPIYRME